MSHTHSEKKPLMKRNAFKHQWYLEWYKNQHERSWNVRSNSRWRRCLDLESGVYRSRAWEFGEITWDDNDVGLVGDALVPVLLRDEHHPVLGDCHCVSHQLWSMARVWPAPGLIRGQLILPTGESGLWGRLARPSTALCLALPGGQTSFQTQLFRPQSSYSSYPWSYIFHAILQQGWCIFHGNGSNWLVNANS